MNKARPVRHIEAPGKEWDAAACTFCIAVLHHLIFRKSEFVNAVGGGVTRRRCFLVLCRPGAAGGCCGRCSPLFLLETNPASIA